MSTQQFSFQSADVRHAKNWTWARAVLLSAPVKRSARDYRLYIQLPFYRQWQPGQFVMLRWGTHVIGRPFAIVSWHKDTQGSVLELWIRRLGAASEELFERAREGMGVEVFAPLGIGPEFPIQVPNTGNLRTLYVSGGVGAASLLSFLAGVSDNKAQYQWVHGERSWGDFDQDLEPDILCLEQVDVSNSNPLSHARSKVCQGRVTAGLDQISLNGFGRIYCCGPSSMLEALVVYFQKRQFDLGRLFLGLEEKMACGIGLCFSCSVRTTDGMQRCCLEGPWFAASSLDRHFEFRKAVSS